MGFTRREPRYTVRAVVNGYVNAGALLLLIVSSIARAQVSLGEMISRDPLSFEPSAILVSNEALEKTHQRVETVLLRYMVGKKVDASSLARHVVSECIRYGFYPSFVLSLIHVESSFRPGVVSNAGAIGLMQVMPSTGFSIAQKLGIRVKSVQKVKRLLVNPYVNVSVGIYYLSRLRFRFLGVPHHYLPAYNAGPTVVSKQLKLGHKLYSSTLEYHDRIVGYMEELRDEGLDNPFFRGYEPNSSDLAFLMLASQ